MIPVTETFRMALRALRRNTLRSILTALGIIIGVAAVVAMVSIGEGANTTLRWAIAIGATLIIVGAVIFSKRRPIAVGEEQVNAPAA